MAGVASSASRRRLVAVIILAISVLAGAASPTFAHTEVQRAEPGPGSEASGVIDEVSLLFLDEIEPGGVIEVASEAGNAVEGLGEAALDADGRTMRVSFDPLEEPGTYVVSYSFVAVDGDAQNEAYTFAFLGAEESDDDGRSPALVLAAGLGVIVATAFGVAIGRRRRGALGPR